MSSFKVLSYNIHKGFSATNLNFVLNRIKESIELVHADVVMLQEVVGHNEKHSRKLVEWPRVSQFEFLADKLWPHYAYGKNAVYTEGHHGNAILSKFPISFSENLDISTNKLERRGLLHAVCEFPEEKRQLHVICMHLGLFETGRRIQVKRLAERIKEMVPKNAPLIVAGDFNDWRQNASKVLETGLGLKEVFFFSKGEHARTFPSWLPVLKLDRIYFRGLELVRTESFSSGVWADLSDHVAICAEFRI